MNVYRGVNHWNGTNWGILNRIGDDNFYAVPIKSIGFRDCTRRVPFIRSGKLIVNNPEDEDDDSSKYVRGYWWNKKTNTRLPNTTKPLTNNTGVWGNYRDYEYYYYLHQNYKDY